MEFERKNERRDKRSDIARFFLKIFYLYLGIVNSDL